MSGGFSESFDNGTGALNNRWGNVDTSVKGEVTLRDTSGIMETGAGHGYGIYSITVKMTGDQPGPAALLWPVDDKWPGPEMDLAEFIGGRPYGTVHWRNSNGSDGYKSVFYDGVDETQKHTYTLDWQQDKATFSVDGKERGSITDHISADADHGGVNEHFGINNSNHNTSVTVYDVSYTPHGGDDVWK